MKKTFKFIAASIVIFAAASCAKENPAVQETEFTNHTFSATIEEPADGKSDIADNGVLTFTAGDYLIVFNNNTTNINYYKKDFVEESGKYVIKSGEKVVAQRIEISNDMIADAGRTLNFSTVVDAYKSGTGLSCNCYNFIYFSAKGYNDFNNFSSRNDNTNYAGQITVYRHSWDTGSTPWKDYTVDKKKVMCYGRSDTASGKVKFYHFDSQFKFKVSDIESYDKVTFEVNGTPSNTNCINPDVLFRSGLIKDLSKEFVWPNLNYDKLEPFAYTRNGNGSSDVINVTLSGDASSVYYVAVPPMYTYANGIKIKLYKNGEVLKTLEAKQSITTVRGGILDFGDLAKVKKDTYTSYRDKWVDKVPFKIGETMVNPAEEPYKSMTPIYVESDCSIKAVPGWTNTNNVIFIKEGVTLTIDDAKYWNDAPAKLFIIGDKIGTRSNVVWQKTLAPRGGAVVLKNINITSSVSNSIDSEGKLSSYMIVDGCRIVLPAGGEFATATKGASSGWDKIELIDNDFVFTSGSNCKFANVCPTAAYTFSSLVVKNNQCYSSDENLAGQNSCLIWDYWQGRTSFNSADIENNTFVNTSYNYNVIYCAAQGVAVGGTLTIKNNLNYVNGGATGYAKIFLLADANKTGVTINETNNYAWATSSIAKLQVWGNVSCKTFSADPFASKDFTNGKFVLTSAAETQAPGCGAKR